MRYQQRGSRHDEGNDRVFTKNQQSTDMTLERMECSIAGIIDRAEVLKTRVSTTDQDKLLNDTHVDDHDKVDKMEEVDDKEPFNPPTWPPPPRQHRYDHQAHQDLPRPPRRPNWQRMGGHPHHGLTNSTLTVMMILSLKLSLRFLSSMVCMMLKLI
jgi:G3E family GTPase